MKRRRARGRPAGGSEAIVSAILATTLTHLERHGFEDLSVEEQGLSSATTNVLWGFFNLVVGYLLACRVGAFSLRKTPHVVVFGVGVFAISMLCARAFGPFHGGG